MKARLKKPADLKRRKFSLPELLVFVLVFGLVGYILIRVFAASNPNLQGDLNNDNRVDVTDMSILLSNYGTTNAAADVNGDGAVNVLDMSILLSNYGKTYTPAANFTTSLTSGMTITPPYTWTFNPGVSSVKGYFWADGVLVGTAVPNASGSYSFAIQTTTLTAGAHTLGHAWDLADGTHQSPSSSYQVTIDNGTTLPPPPTGTVYFDGRAKNMTLLTSTGYAAPDGSIGTIVSKQSPQMWDCLCFTNNSMSLVSDAYYGKAFKNTEGPGDRNPWNNGAPAYDASGQVSKIMPNDLGKTDYYAFAIKVPTGWQNPDWSSLLSLGYETRAWDQLALNVNLVNGTLTYQFYQNAGYVNCPTTTCAGTGFASVNIQPVAYDQWTEFIYAVKWSTTKDGSAKVYTRVPGGTWALKMDRENIDTYLYGATSYGTVRQDMSDMTTIVDKFGLYFGYWDTSRTSFPYETVLHNGITISSDLQTAQSTLP